MRINEYFGCDRHGREYRFIDRRFFINDTISAQTWYYSSRAQFQQLLTELNKSIHERKLAAKISNKRKQIECQMAETESRTERAKGRKMSYFELIANPTMTTGKKQVNPFRLGMEAKQLKTCFKIYTAKVYEFISEMSPSLGMKAFSMNIDKITSQIDVLREALVEFKRKIDFAFMHPNWSGLVKTWLEAIQHCNTMRDFITVLSIFQTCINEDVYIKDWHNESSHINCKQNEWHESDVRSGWMWKSHTRRSHSMKNYNQINDSERKEREKTVATMVEKRSKSIRNGRKSTATEKQLIEIIHRKTICSQVEDIILAIKKSNQNQNEYKLCHCNSTICDYCSARKTLHAKCETFQKSHQYIIKTIVFEIVQRALPKLQFDCAKGINTQLSTETDAGCEVCQIKSAEKMDLGCEHHSPVELMRSTLKYPPTHNFLGKNGIRSMNVLPKHELRKLARRGGIAKVNGFIQKHSAQQPSLSTCWRYDTMNVRTLAALCYQIQKLWTCLRWKDMKAESASLRNTSTVTKNIISIRKHGRFSEKTSYLKSTKTMRFDYKVPGTQLQEGNNCHQNRKKKTKTKKRLIHSYLQSLHKML